MDFTPTNNPNQYLYNGKELQNDLDLGWYDYGARFYDPAAPHWTTPDPLAEKYFSTSPFAYVQNNPIRYLDPFGMEGEDHNDENENLVIVDKELIEEFLRSINFFFLNNDNGTNDDTDQNNSKGDNKKTKKRTPTCRKFATCGHSAVSFIGNLLYCRVY